MRTAPCNLAIKTGERKWITCSPVRRKYIILFLIIFSLKKNNRSVRTVLLNHMVAFTKCKTLDLVTYQLILFTDVQAKANINVGDPRGKIVKEKPTFLPWGKEEHGGRDWSWAGLCIAYTRIGTYDDCSFLMLESRDLYINLLHNHWPRSFCVTCATVFQS